jgi:exosortase
LARAILGVTALASLVSGWRFRQALHPGVWALCLLALPVMPSLQFYCGYALRHLAALGAAGLLHASGFPVSAAGAAIEWTGGVVSVDAPCSGLSMLWTMGFMAACLACVSGWGWRGTAGAGALAVVASVAANALRASSLFILETGGTAVPGWLHEGVGWVCFAAAAACMASAAIKGERWAASR